MAKEERGCVIARTRNVDNWGYRSLAWNVTKLERAEKHKRLEAIRYAKEATARGYEMFLDGEKRRAQTRNEITAARAYEDLLRAPDRVLTEQEKRVAMDVREDEVLEMYQKLSVTERVHLAAQLPAEYIYVEDLDVDVIKETQELRQSMKPLEKLIANELEATHFKNAVVILVPDKVQTQDGKEVNIRKVQTLNTSQNAPLRAGRRPASAAEIRKAKAKKLLYTHREKVVAIRDQVLSYENMDDKEVLIQLAKAKLPAEADPLEQSQMEDSSV